MTLMSCGCAANARMSRPDGRGLVPGCLAHCNTTPMPVPPKLEGREASCSHCGKRAPSSERLAFFRHRPADETDQFYCGCWGWD